MIPFSSVHFYHITYEIYSSCRTLNQQGISRNNVKIKEAVLAQETQTTSGVSSNRNFNTKEYVLTNALEGLAEKPQC